MARYDKYDPKAGGYRARLAEDFHDSENFSKPLAVGHDAAGLLVIGAGANTGITGVLIRDRKANAGDVLDVMTHGEIVDFDSDPGTSYYGASDGTVSSTAAGGQFLGHTVEAGRLIVRVAKGGA